VDLAEIWYLGDDTEGDVDHPKWWAFKLLMWCNFSDGFG
jgi:hypothetical protein